MLTTKKLKSDLIGNIFLLFIVIIIFFSVFEVSVRILWKDQRNDYPLEMFIRDETKGYVMTPNYSGSFVSSQYKKIPIEINSKGLRDYEHDYNKSDETIRILFLGDSVTFGAGINLKDSYTKLFEKTLNKKEQKFETINMGVSGYEIEQEYSYYFEEGFKYNPNIVVISIVLNDIQNVNILEVQKNWFESENSFERIVKKFCLSCKFTYSKIKDISESSEEYNQEYFENIYYKWNESEFELYSEKIISLNENITKSQGKLVLVIIPYTQQFTNWQDYGTLPQEKLKDFGKKENIEVIDMMPYLDNPNFEKYYFPADNVHPTEDGHKLINAGLLKEFSIREII